MSVNPAIQDVGLAAIIKRSAGDVSTYVYIKPKSKAGGYEFEAWLPTDCGVVDGDLIEVAGTYATENYFVINIVPDDRAGDFFKFNVKLFRCNHIVAIKSYNKTTKKFDSVQTGVPCLIIDGGAIQMSDRAVIIPGFNGKDGSYFLYCQPNGINRNSVIIDDAGVLLKIAGTINPYFAKGLIEVTVKAEGS